MDLPFASIAPADSTQLDTAMDSDVSPVPLLTDSDEALSHKAGEPYSPEFPFVPSMGFSVSAPDFSITKTSPGTATPVEEDFDLEDQIADMLIRNPNRT